MHDKSVAELQRGLRARAFSSVELTQACLARIEALDGRLNSLITVTGERALAQARAADARLADGSAGPLTGIPLLHKDIFCTSGVRTSCGSRMLDNFVAPYDATVVERLDAGGMCMLGKTNMDEFAMGSSTEASFYGPTRNPWDLERVPGGSSGGSAAAVAGRLAPPATCTDTGGSIRQPAAMCGVTGIKPTYGRVSRYGMVAFASSLDQGGVMGRSAEDAAWLLAAMAGFDARDSTSIDQPVDDYPAMLERASRGCASGCRRNTSTKASIRQSPRACRRRSGSSSAWER
jgi:aspartyl-tRNA(Asn)/glutamyl-tRNA(Gln) amidotransferase subunit A